MNDDLQPERLLAAYASGIFPMADDDGTLRWFAPDTRAILEFENLRVSRSLRAVLRRGTFAMRINTDFENVMRACADRPEGTWISQEIFEAYVRLHELGFAHSVEAWRNDRLVGGLYGVSLGGAFFGESMFHRMTDASKVALVYLVERMQVRGFLLLDMQFITDHLQSLGATEITRADYERRLGEATRVSCAFDDEVGPTCLASE